MLNTDDLPEERRFDLFCRGLGASHDATRLPDDDRPFSARLDAWLFGSMAITGGRQMACRMVRTTDRIKADRFDYFTLMLVREGRVSGWANGPIAWGAGEIAVLDLARPMDVSATDNHNIGIRLPRTAIRTLLQPFPTLHGRVLRGTAARLVADHMTSLWRHASEVSSGDVSLILNATASIVAGCLAERDAQPTPPSRSSGRSFAVRQSVMRYVDLHLADVKLGTMSICTALGLSRASLYRALTGDGGVASYILGRRLDAIHAAIVDAAQARTLADLAFATGFTSYSHFSAAFRNRFGHSPRQAQRTALAAGLGRNGSVDGIRDAYGSWLRGLRCGASAADQVSISLNQQAT